MAFCNQCGHRNHEDANFCSSCGTVLTDRPSDATITLHPVDALGDPGEEKFEVRLPDRSTSSGILVVMRGSSPGTELPLESDITTAGRHPASDLFLDDITVSRRHAEFVRNDGSYSVRDVGSLNGTYVNHDRVEEATLASGDEVQIGKFKLIFLAAVDN